MSDVCLYSSVLNNIVNTPISEDVIFSTNHVMAVQIGTEPLVIQCVR